jgi:hypothetical protein
MTTDRNSGATPAGGYGDSERDSTERGYSESQRGYVENDSSTLRGDSGGSHSIGRAPERDDTYDTSRRTEYVQHEARPIQTVERPVQVAVGMDRRDGVRWGPVWAGLLTALTTFLLLELGCYALGALTLGSGQADDNAALITGILALVAFFIGGLIAGATALWKGLFSGLLHGFLVWALGVVAFIALTFFGASALLGSFGDLTSQLGVGPQEVQSSTELTEEESAQAADEAQDAATPAFWGLLLPLLAAMIGGLIGSKIWPRKKDQEPDTVHAHT